MTAPTKRSPSRSKDRFAELAVNGGPPVRPRPLPYARQSVSEQDIRAVTDCLRSDWLTTGPNVKEFEQAIAKTAGVPYACAVNNGTSALDAALHALRLEPGDEVIVPTMTFAASANAVLYQGATPVFADVDSTSLLLSPAEAKEKITSRTRAILAVDYAGQPCDYDGLRALCREHNLKLVADAAHSLGGTYRGRPVGALADVTTFSFHPVKHIACGEGGMVVTSESEIAAAVNRYRNHGITTDHRQREATGAWFYEMVELGNNLRLSDIHSALGLSQLARLPEFIARRRAIAARYQQAFANRRDLRALTVASEVAHAYHLFVITCELTHLSADRDTIFRALRAEGIGVNVHYIPVHLHPYYRKTMHTGVGLCPNAENAYQRILSLPMFPAMTEADVSDVIEAVEKVFDAYAR